MIITLFAILFILSFNVPSSWAGGSLQYGWAGFTIGFSGTIPGGVVSANYAYGYPAPGVVYRRPCPPQYGYYPPPRVVYKRPCPPPRFAYRRPYHSHRYYYESRGYYNKRRVGCKK